MRMMTHVHRQVHYRRMHYRRVHYRQVNYRQVQSVLLAILMLVSLGVSASPDNVPAICLSQHANAFLPSVSTNGEESQVWPVCQKGPTVWLPKEIFSQHNVLNYSGWRVTQRQGQAFVLMDIPSKVLSWNKETQHLALHLDSSRFSGSETDMQQTDSVPAAITKPSSASGAFVNYSVMTTAVNQSGGHFTSATGEMGVFSKDKGVFLQTGVYTPELFNSEASQVASETQTPQWLRLDSTWRKDNWHHLSTLELGDSTTSNAHWGGSVNFAGISYYKNFSLQPSLDIRSLPAITGNSNLPQNMQLEVNGVPVANYQVNPGSYQFYNIPVSNGSGLITVQTKDKDGKVTSYSVPYFVDDDLLRAGVSSYSYQFGWIRRNYGVEDFDYGQAVATANYMRGVSSDWTYELHTSLLIQQQTLGSTQFYRLGSRGIVTADTAVSAASSGVGGLVALGYQYRFSSVDLYSNYQITSPLFTQLSSVGLESNNGSQTSVGATLPLWDWGTFGVSALYQRANSESSNSSHVYTSTFQASITRNLSLTGSYQANFGDSHLWNLGCNISYQFGQNSSVMTSYQQDQESDTQFMSYSNNYRLPGRKYLSSNLSVSQNSLDDQNQLNGSVYLGGTSTGDYSARFYQYGTQNQVTATANGGLLWMDNHAFMTPTLNSGFSVADTSGVSGVGIYQNGAYLGKSDKDGLFVVPNLPSYLASEITLSPNLPLDLKVTKQEKKVMPSYRSGVIADFDIQHIHQILVRVTTKDGAPLGLGTEVKVGRGDDFHNSVIGTNGLLYFAHSGHHFHGEVLSGNDKGGEFTVDFNPTENIVVRTSAVCLPSTSSS